jgi:hypothetical protein
MAKTGAPLGRVFDGGIVPLDKMGGERSGRKTGISGLVVVPKTFGQARMASRKSSNRVQSPRLFGLFDDDVPEFQKLDQLKFEFHQLVST